MIKKWVKILPYWLVMKFVRSFNASIGTINNQTMNYFQIDEGEFVVFSPEIQEVFNKRKREKRQIKTNRKLERINKKINNDYELKIALENQFKEERYLND